MTQFGIENLFYGNEITTLLTICFLIVTGFYFGVNPSVGLLCAQHGPFIIKEGSDFLMFMPESPSFINLNSKWFESVKKFLHADQTNSRSAWLEFSRLFFYIKVYSTLLHFHVEKPDQVWSLSYVKPSQTKLSHENVQNVWVKDNREWLTTVHEWYNSGQEVTCMSPCFWII